MLQIELSVNGCIIDFIDIVNVGTSYDKATYEVSYQGKRFGFIHNRTKGAVVCAMKALQAITKEAPSLLEQKEPAAKKFQRGLNLSQDMLNSLRE